MYTIICDPDVCTNLHFLLWKRFIFVCRGTDRFLDQSYKKYYDNDKNYKSGHEKILQCSNNQWCYNNTKLLSACMTTDETAFVHQCKCCVVVCKVHPGKQNLCLISYL